MNELDQVKEELAIAQKLLSDLGFRHNYNIENDSLRLYLKIIADMYPKEMAMVENTIDVINDSRDGTHVFVPIPTDALRIVRNCPNSLCAAKAMSTKFNKYEWFLQRLVEHYYTTYDPMTHKNIADIARDLLKDPL